MITRVSLGVLLLGWTLEEALDEVVLCVVEGENVDDHGVEGKEDRRESANVTEQHE